MDHLLEDTSGYSGHGDLQGDLSGSHNSDDAAGDYEKCSSGGSPTRERVKREKEEADVEACYSTRSSATYDEGIY
jgi:hypothetical protein